MYMYIHVCCGGNGVVVLMCVCVCLLSFFKIFVILSHVHCDALYK